MASEIVFEVQGPPPLKGEALSMFNPTHGQRTRVDRLLEAARGAMAAQGVQPFAGDMHLGLEVTVRIPHGGKHLGDATNALGGVADVLEDKAGRQWLERTELTDVYLYPNDDQIREVRYREEHAACASYEVRVWLLEDQ